MVAQLYFVTRCALLDALEALHDQRDAVIALDYLRSLFGSREGIGTQMAVRATERLADPETIAASCEALATELLQELADINHPIPDAVPAPD